MSFPFDATLKDTIQQFTRDFQTAFRLTGTPATVLNVDLSTLSAATDIVLGHGNPLQSITDFNFQSGPDPDLARRILLYSAILPYRFGVPVHSIVLLLRPVADSPRVTARVRYAGRKRRGKMDFTFEVVRLWQRPVRNFLKGGVGTLPLATLCRMPHDAPLEDALPPIIRRIDERLQNEASPEDARKLLLAAYVLTGLRMPRDLAAELFQGLPSMRESSTYQAILDEGRVAALQETLLDLGRIQCGPIDSTTEQAIRAIQDLQRLKQLTQRLLHVNSWQDLLAMP